MKAFARLKLAEEKTIKQTPLFAQQADMGSNAANLSPNSPSYTV